MLIRLITIDSKVCTIVKLLPIWKQILFSHFNLDLIIDIILKPCRYTICSHLWCHLRWCQTLEQMDLEH